MTPSTSLQHAHKAVELDLLFRLVAIGARNYRARPNEREPALALILRNALRLYVAHVGKAAAGQTVLAVLEEQPIDESSAHPHIQVVESVAHAAN